MRPTSGSAWLSVPGTRVLLAVVVGLALSGCSLKRTAVNIMGDALGGGGSVYATDDDPDLIREALPFGLKTLESLLTVSPEHRGLLLGVARATIVYAYLLQDEADRLDATDLARARSLRLRARALYLRGRDASLRGLEAGHPGFLARLQADRGAALRMTAPSDVPFLYLAGVAWGGALSAAKEDLDLIADLPTAGALIGRVLEIDEAYERGAAHEFLISYEGSRPAGSVDRAREHYRRALEISGGTRASVHLALAESVAIREQNPAEFRALLAAVLAVDPNRVPELRLLNAVAGRRARWLERRVPDLFLEVDHGEESE